MRLGLMCELSVGYLESYVIEVEYPWREKRKLKQYRKSEHGIGNAKHKYWGKPIVKYESPFECVQKGKPGLVFFFVFFECAHPQDPFGLAWANRTLMALRRRSAG